MVTLMLILCKHKKRLKKIGRVNAVLALVVVHQKSPQNKKSGREDVTVRYQMKFQNQEATKKRLLRIEKKNSLMISKKNMKKGRKSLKSAQATRKMWRRQSLGARSARTTRNNAKRKMNLKEKENFSRSKKQIRK